MTPLLNTLKSALLGKTPAAQLAEIEADIVRLEAEPQRLQEERARWVLPALQGSSDAATMIADLDRQKTAVEEQLGNCYQARATLRIALEAERQAGLRRQIEARPKRIAELRRVREALAAEVTEKMTIAAAAMQAMAANADALAAEIDSMTARRFLAFGAFRHRAQSAFARAFQIDRAAPLTIENSLLGVQSNEVGPRSWLTLAEHEAAGLDDLAPFFDDAGDVEAARARLAARGTETITVPLAGGVFTLVSVEHAFPDETTALRAVAAAEQQGQKLVVVRHAPGFVAVPERFAVAA